MLHAIALVLHNIVLYSMVLHGIALYCMASINHIFLREVTFIYSGTITSFYYDLFFCVTVLYGRKSADHAKPHFDVIFFCIFPLIFLV